MLWKARFEFTYDDEMNAEKVAKLLDLDNRIAPRNLKLVTFKEGVTVITMFQHEKLNTFQATIEDLLFSEKLIEGLVSYVGRKSRKKQP